MCGLPYIICEGVSEDYIYAKKYQIGVVLKSFNKIHVSESIQDIDNLFFSYSFFRFSYS